MICFRSQDGWGGGGALDEGMMKQKCPCPPTYLVIERNRRVMSENMTESLRL